MNMQHNVVWLNNKKYNNEWRNARTTGTRISELWKSSHYSSAYWAIVAEFWAKYENDCQYADEQR